MHEAYRPISLLVAFWPTREFEFPGDLPAFGEQIRAQFNQFQEIRVMQAEGPVPPEMPVVVLIGEGGRWALELAPAKIVLRRTVETPDELGALFTAVKNMLMPIHSWMAENHNLRVSRLGSLTQFFCDTRSSANDKIAAYFLQPRALQGQAPMEVQLGILARLALDDGSIVNRWLRVQPLRTADPTHVDLAAKIEVDLNTPAEDTHVRTGRDIVNFIDAVQKHLQERLPLLSDPDFFA